MWPHLLGGLFWLEREPKRNTPIWRGEGGSPCFENARCLCLFVVCSQVEWASLGYELCSVFERFLNENQATKDQIAHVTWLQEMIGFGSPIPHETHHVQSLRTLSQRVQSFSQLANENLTHFRSSALLRAATSTARGGRNAWVHTGMGRSSIARGFHGTGFVHSSLEFKSRDFLQSPISE